ncbi:hypothetical protein CSB93_7069 (plasmid) [Pseudomonas paraeruginosa]|uniref:Uncharacterized protein n=1 Tax=Pseudomonas paraeruginosa TaxID=2994495 RepID=A0A2R3IKU8_9PSED|nr:hypothetical protein CSB93_7069 [Pseudomonas paraeruginosa]AWE88909.1 hypothetical protein CSC28_7006 [Pseudomonas paraeruginosa]
MLTAVHAANLGRWIEGGQSHRISARPVNRLCWWSSGLYFSCGHGGVFLD